MAPDALEQRDGQAGRVVAGPVEQPVWPGRVTPERTGPLLCGQVRTGGKFIRSPDSRQTRPCQIDQAHWSCYLDGCERQDQAVALPDGVDTADDAKAEHLDEGTCRLLGDIQHSETAKRIVESVAAGGSEK